MAVIYNQNIVCRDDTNISPAGEKSMWLICAECSLNVLETRSDCIVVSVSIIGTTEVADGMFEETVAGKENINESEATPAPVDLFDDENVCCCKPQHLSRELNQRLPS